MSSYGGSPLAPPPLPHLPPPPLTSSTAGQPIPHPIQSTSSVAIGSPPSAVVPSSTPVIQPPPPPLLQQQQPQPLAPPMMPVIQQQQQQPPPLLQQPQFFPQQLPPQLLQQSPMPLAPQHFYVPPPPQPPLSHHIPLDFHQAMGIPMPITGTSILQAIADTKLINVGDTNQPFIIQQQQQQQFLQHQQQQQQPVNDQQQTSNQSVPRFRRENKFRVLIPQTNVGMTVTKDGQTTPTTPVGKKIQTIILNKSRTNALPPVNEAATNPSFTFGNIFPDIQKMSPFSNLPTSPSTKKNLTPWSMNGKLPSLSHLMSLDLGHTTTTTNYK
ncbi:hypothetical protein DFA_03183 [Cavenderia fasciculata]|uniref:Uncharacterized protein n=1 Tax=Cavenderia fasciculata TaxID=261658 RepID=F4PGV4_CACFS|nr:uncharacterized protein DFA_03183 [Cavenderia fasciculata]EGG24938.1 hypothetical protein DFA_03183 [Cavenderia fasciculata]|eukprot:XP_004362789.1 hypothetical protein DFA_03183 [Cavenderia fasciculata]